jgi:hypothetical protein
LGDPARSGDVLLDVLEHGWALLKGLEVALIVGDDDLTEAGRVDEERKARQEPPVEGETVLRVFALREYVTAVQEHLDRLAGSRP